MTEIETTVNESLGSSWVIVIGNPVDGFSYHGPFNDYDTAFKAGENINDLEYWIVQVDPWEE